MCLLDNAFCFRADSRQKGRSVSCLGKAALCEGVKCVD